MQDVFEDRLTVSRMHKFHHLLHYADSIRENGPVKLWWTARFESFHQEIKRKSYVSRNFINTPLLVAKHLAYLFSYNQSYFETEDEFWFENGKLTVRGVEFQTGYLICVNVPSNGLPIFGEIIKIINESETPKFKVKIFKTIKWDDIFHAFEIEKMDTIEIVDVKNWLLLKSTKSPFAIWRNINKNPNKTLNYVSPKTCVNVE